MSALRSIPKIGSIKPRQPPSTTPPPPAKTAGRPMPDPGHQTMFPQGPELYHLGQKRHEGGEVGQKPKDFPGTQPEFVWFVASSWYHDDPKDPFVGPWVGSLTHKRGVWQFQAPEGPGLPKTAGGSVSDFVYQQPGGFNRIVRIEGYYFHIGMGPVVQARDTYLVNQAGRGGDQVYRVNDGDYMDDLTGQKAVHLLADILAGRQTIGAVGGGIAQPPRYADFLTSTR